MYLYTRYKISIKLVRMENNIVLLFYRNDILGIKRFTLGIRKPISYELMNVQEIPSY